MNRAGAIDGRDVSGSATTLADPGESTNLFPVSDMNGADMDRDGQLSTEDVDGFVSALIQ